MEAKNLLKDLLESWKESLFLYKDKRFWLVALKTIKETYRTLFKQFWWLILLYYISEYMLGQAMKKTPVELNTSLIVLPIIKLLVTALFFYVLVLLVRSSLGRKDIHYYNGHLSYFPIFFIILLLFWAIWYVIPVFLGAPPIAQFNYKYLILRTVVHFTTILFSPFLLFYSFFYFDSHLTLRTIVLRLWSAFKMLIYTYPFCFIQTLLISLLVLLLIGVVHLVSLLIRSENSFSTIFDFLATYGPLLVVPIFIGIFYPLYTKQVHDHYDRYAL